jgi:hypothetical protein
LDAAVGFGLGRRLFAFLTVLALTTTIMVTLSACGSADGGQGEDGQGEGSPLPLSNKSAGRGSKRREAVSRTLNLRHLTTATAREAVPPGARSTG